MHPHSFRRRFGRAWRETHTFRWREIIGAFVLAVGSGFGAYLIARDNAAFRLSTAIIPLVFGVIALALFYALIHGMVVLWHLA